MLVIENCNSLSDLRQKLIDGEEVRTARYEPCGDAIGREDALMALTGEWTEPTDELIHQFIRRIKNLPPVTPQPKTGEWIGDAKTYYEELNKRGLGVDEYTPYFTDDIACSECLAKYSMLDNETQFFKYCPNCGCRMVEPQKSEKAWQENPEPYKVESEV